MTVENICTFRLDDVKLFAVCVDTDDSDKASTVSSTAAIVNFAPILSGDSGRRKRSRVRTTVGEFCNVHTSLAGTTSGSTLLSPSLSEQGYDIFFLRRGGSCLCWDIQ